MKHATLAISVLFPVLVAVSCTITPEGTGTTSDTTSGSEKGGAGGGTSSGGGEGGISFTTGSGASSGSGTGGVGGGCAATTQTATLVPLDMYIMLDTSGSMLEATSSGVTKWNAVKGAFTAFFQDAGSNGMGVGLQYFPLYNPGNPASCTTSADCGIYGPCANKACNSGPNLVFCANNQDCFSGSCVDVGYCANSRATHCLNIGGTCNNGLGTCTALTTAHCANSSVSCNTAAYGTPAVNIGVLPSTSQALIDSMNAKPPVGGTPTAAALTGAVDQAKSYATANPTHKVVAVLATDGLPTLCNPTDFNGISNIASTAFNGSPSIPTFVIGVFAGNDMTAKTNLDMLASAGGTNQAFIVDTSTNVEQAFLQALNAIRGQKLACEYLIPTPPAGQTLDYGKVNVEHTPMGSATPTTIYYVGDASKCDPTTGGWYYDVDPASGGTPTKIQICPATCAVFDAGGQIQIALGCATVGVPQ